MPETDPAQEAQVKPELSEAEVYAYFLRAALDRETIESDLFFERLRQVFATARLRGVKLTPKVIKLIADSMQLTKDLSLPSLSASAVAWEDKIPLTAEALKVVKSGMSTQEFLSNPDLQQKVGQLDLFFAELKSSQEELLNDREFSALLAQLDTSEAESSQRQAVIGELRQTSDADLAALSEVVAAL